ncbi:MAG: UDP-galactopyranose mutase [Elusimicrobiota bacterium]|jgi:UDP-galactopyranose mutase|nr:UDP-galactopyranose mutase [Elusimicrobiota bacterium]
MKKIKNLIVGAGLSGAILAERIADEKKENILVIDKRNHIGGNCFDYLDKNGILIHKYGPHVFHTNFEEVWNYLSKFTKWNYFFLKPRALIDGIKATLPFNLNTLYQVFPKSMAENFEKKLIEKFGYNVKIPILELKRKDDDLKFLANYIYENVFLNYTKKQWGLKPEEIDENVTARVPIYISRDDRYFQDKYQGIPLNGYTKMVENILNNSLIEISLNTDFRDVKNEIDYEKLFFTGAIDEFFDYEFGELPYRSLNFDIQEKEVEYYQETAVINYPNNYDFTRICEHKYFLNQKSNKTVISIEYSEKFVLGENERYYPIENPKNKNLYEKYLKYSKSLKNVYFLGRLGDYKYYNMDLTVDRALNFFENQIK